MKDVKKNWAKYCILQEMGCKEGWEKYTVMICLGNIQLHLVILHSICNGNSIREISIWRVRCGGRTESMVIIMQHWRMTTPVANKNGFIPAHREKNGKIQLYR